MRQRYSGSFTLSKDTTAKEMLHCFALAYFAVCKKKNIDPSIEGLTDALCEDNYSKYDRYISYPLITSNLKDSQKNKLNTIHEAFPALTRKKLNELEELYQVKEAVRKITKKKVSDRTSQDEKNLKQFKSKQEKLVEQISNTEEIRKSFVSSRSTSKQTIKNKLYIFSGDNEGAESWVKSAFWTAQIMSKKGLISESYSDYIYAHSTSYHARLVKDIPLTEACLRIIASQGISTRADMLNPTDIYAIKTQQFSSIINKYKKETEKIISGEVNNASSFNFLTGNLIRSKSMIPISLKKCTTENPTVYLTGLTQNLSVELEPLVDQYTLLIEYFSRLKDPEILKNEIETLVTLKNIDYKHNIETFKVYFDFNYSELNIPDSDGKKIKLHDESYFLATASMTWNAMPTDKSGSVIGAYTGGAGFTLVADILKKYPTTTKIFNQIVGKRKLAFKTALSSIGIDVKDSDLPMVLSKKTILNESADQNKIKTQIQRLVPQKNPIFYKNIYGLYLVTLNSLLIGESIDSKEIKEIWKSLGSFTKQIKNKKIESLLPKQTLEAYNFAKKSQTSIQSGTLKQYAKIAHQENRVAKLEALWFFMSGGKQHLNDYFKKQITLTIYGLITKKGSKIFILEPDGVYKSGEKKGQKKYKSISDALGFRTTPHYLIGNAG
jgi:hypothetical protein